LPTKWTGGSRSRGSRPSSLSRTNGLRSANSSESENDLLRVGEFAIAGLEETDREVFWLSGGRMASIWFRKSAGTRRPDTGLMLATLGGALFYAAACASACRAKKRIML
jgi:hypothetical protein